MSDLSQMMFDLLEAEKGLRNDLKKSESDMKARKYAQQAQSIGKIGDIAASSSIRTVSADKKEKEQLKLRAERLAKARKKEREYFVKSKVANELTSKLADFDKSIAESADQDPVDLQQEYDSGKFYQQKQELLGFIQQQRQLGLNDTDAFSFNSQINRHFGRARSLNIVNAKKKTIERNTNAINAEAQNLFARVLNGDQSLVEAYTQAMSNVRGRVPAGAEGKTSELLTSTGFEAMILYGINKGDKAGVEKAFSNPKIMKYFTPAKQLQLRNAAKTSWAAINKMPGKIATELNKLHKNANIQNFLAYTIPRAGKDTAMHDAIIKTSALIVKQANSPDHILTKERANEIIKNSKLNMSNKEHKDYASALINVFDKLSAKKVNEPVEFLEQVNPERFRTMSLPEIHKATNGRYASKDTLFKLGALLSKASVSNDPKDKMAPGLFMRRTFKNGGSALESQQNAIIVQRALDVHKQVIEKREGKNSRNYQVASLVSSLRSGFVSKGNFDKALNALRDPLVASNLALGNKSAPEGWYEKTAGRPGTTEALDVVRILAVEETMKDHPEATESEKREEFKKKLNDVGKRMLDDLDYFMKYDKEHHRMPSSKRVVSGRTALTFTQDELTAFDSTGKNPDAQRFFNQFHLEYYRAFVKSATLYPEGKGYMLTLIPNNDGTGFFLGVEHSEEGENALTDKNGKPIVITREMILRDGGLTKEWMQENL